MTAIVDPTVEPTIPHCDRPTRLVVVADHRPGPHPTDSDQIEWWLPVLGPTSAALARILARSVADSDAEWDTANLARRVGLGASCSRLWASLERLHMFHVLTFISTDVVTIRLQLPKLRPGQLDVLPADLAEAYRAWLLQ